MFHLKDPSRLIFRQRLEERRANLQRVYGIGSFPGNVGAPGTGRGKSCTGRQIVQLGTLSPWTVSRTIVKTKSPVRIAR